MADLQEFQFDAREVEPNGIFEPIPAGKYNATIIESDMEQTKSGNGSFLKLTLQIQGGQYDGRTLIDRLNLKNPSQQAVDIARQTLSAICHAVDVMTPKDSADLHNKTLVVSVKVKNREDNGEPTNEIKGYSKFDPTKRPTSPTQANTTNGTPSDPWKKS